LTNSPIFEKQLALNACWKDIGGTVVIPGTNRSADRFVLASFYINATKQSGDPRQAVADVLSVMRNVSVPHGNSTPGQPNISSTLRRTVADQKNLTYFFESTFSPSLISVRINELDVSPALACGTSPTAAAPTSPATKPQTGPAAQLPRVKLKRRTQKLKHAKNKKAGGSILRLESL